MHVHVLHYTYTYMYMVVTNYMYDILFIVFLLFLSLLPRSPADLCVRKTVWFLAAATDTHVSPLRPSTTLGDCMGERGKEKMVHWVYMCFISSLPL